MVIYATITALAVVVLILLPLLRSSIRDLERTYVIDGKECRIEKKASIYDADSNRFYNGVLYYTLDDGKYYIKREEEFFNGHRNK